jgi:hypothetical protein
MHTPYHTQAYIDELHRKADQARLISEAAGHHDTPPLFQRGRDVLGRALIALGSRLSQPDCIPVESTTVCTVSSGGTTLVLGECAG